MTHTCKTQTQYKQYNKNPVSQPHPPCQPLLAWEHPSRLPKTLAHTGTVEGSIAPIYTAHTRKYALMCEPRTPTQLCAKWWEQSAVGILMRVCLKPRTSVCSICAGELWALMPSRPPLLTCPPLNHGSVPPCPTLPCGRGVARCKWWC